MGTIIVVNGSNDLVQCQVSNNSGGSADWYNIQPGATLSWGRSGWENVVVKSGNRHSCLWVNRGYPATVTFYGFDTELHVARENPQSGSFTVYNKSPVATFASVSAGPWKEIRASANYRFDGVSGWQTIAFKNPTDAIRKGVYVTNNGTDATVEFKGFGQEITSKDGPLTHIRAEHMAEAINIAARWNSGQNTVAGNPGGLVISADKVDILESMTPGGRTQSLWDNNQIHTLAMLIYHLKYGDGQPGIVVSVTQDWVKVAAYTDEFDGITVLGFPIAAAKLIAPKRLTVGERVLCVCLFTSRSGGRQGVLGDITMGPRTYDRWYNFQPVVAQFVTDDSMAGACAERMPNSGDPIWQRVLELWEDWKARHGEDYMRLGAPSLVSVQAKYRPRTSADDLELAMKNTVIR